MSKLCSNCNAEIPNEAEFCPKCGSTQIKKIVCESCRYEIEGDVKFCPKCGNEINPSAVSKIEKKKTSLSKKQIIVISIIAFFVLLLAIMLFIPKNSTEAEYDEIFVGEILIDKESIVLVDLRNDIEKYLDYEIYVECLPVDYVEYDGYCIVEMAYIAALSDGSWEYFTDDTFIAHIEWYPEFDGSFSYMLGEPLKVWGTLSGLGSEKDFGGYHAPYIYAYAIE